MSRIAKRIQAIENTFQCRICIHEHTPGISKLLSKKYSTHLNPFCTQIKKDTHSYKFHRCMQCDLDKLHNELHTVQGPVIKYCHAGIAEVIVPIIDENHLTGIIFAGPFQIELQNYAEGIFMSPSPMTRLNQQEKQLQALLPLLPPQTADNITQLLEMLGDSILAEAKKALGNVGTRRDLIFRYIQQNYMKPIGLQDLAEHIGLSPSRMTQVLREECNTTFPDLITEVRIRQAIALLIHSHYTATQIADMCGFSTQAYFHRIFKKSQGITPLQYRKEHGNKARLEV